MPAPISEILSRYNKLRNDRDGTYLHLWREVRKYVYPSEKDDLVEGSEAGCDIFDDTAILARSRLAAGINHWMAPADKRWFEIQTNSKELSKLDEVKNFFSEITRITTTQIANSNWQAELNQCLNDAACGCDAVIFVEDGGADEVLNFRSIPIESVCYAENKYRNIDTMFREMEMTARQIKQLFGYENLPEKIRIASNDKQREDDKFKILHACFPREDRDESRMDNKNMPFYDLYIDIESKALLYEGGFEEFPFAVCRFERTNKEIYGRGPGINLLPSIRQLNKMQEAFVFAMQMSCDPAWLIPDNSIIGNTFDRNHGAINYYKPDPTGNKPEQVRLYTDFQTLSLKIQELQEKIKQGFYLDIFDPLGDLKNITATEAEIRDNGKIIPFAPIAGNLHTQFFRPILQRVVGILSRRGMLPEAPSVLSNDSSYKIEFVSKIALAIQKIESLGWLQTEAALANIFNINPSVSDNFDMDMIARDIAAVNGGNPRWIRTEKDRDEIRKQRAIDEENQARAAEMANAINKVDIMKRPETGSVGDMVISNMGV